MSQLQLENMTVSSLESLLSRRDDKLLEHKLAETPNDNAINLLNATKLLQIGLPCPYLKG